MEGTQLDRKDVMRSGARVLPDGGGRDSPVSIHSSEFGTNEFIIDERWRIDPKLLFVGPRIGEGAHGKVYEGK